jgi:uncharacterized protein YceH (UPF0502 family)
VELTTAQGRVLGALVEKERTTPQGYPLTDNALVAACNQTTSREPVVSYDLATVRVAVRELRELGLLRTVHRSGERSDKHRHELEQGLGLSSAQVALLAVLLLRGPQTLAELRARTERLHVFASGDEVERELSVMADRDEPLVGLLPRQPGRKEARFGQLLAAPVGSAAGGDGPAPTGDSGGGGAAPTGDSGGGARTDGAEIGPPQHEAEGLVAVVADLADEVAALRREVQDLRAALDRATGG